MHPMVTRMYQNILGKGIEYYLRSIKENVTEYYIMKI